MMNQSDELQQLLDLNIKIEGCIRILLARESEEAESLLRGAAEELQQSVNRILGDITEELPQEPELPQEEPELPQEEPEEEPEIPQEEEPLDLPLKEEPQLTKEELQQVKEEPQLPVVTVSDVAAPSADSYRIENMIAQRESRDFSKAFTINDRYRFTRELFNNDMDAFNIALRKLEKMESLSEAYDYFLNELDWDADQPDAADYLAIVASHFNSAE